MTDWLMTISTALLTWLAFMQASEMKRQSRAAETQAYIATQTFALAYRPTVEAETAELVQQFGTGLILIDFKNTGTTSARDVYAEANGNMTSENGTNAERQTGFIRMHGDFSPGRTSIVQLGLTRDELDEVLLGKEQFRIIGKISYGSPIPGSQPLRFTNDSTCFSFVFDPAARHFYQTGC